jgi:hypothetical protein
VWLAVSSSKHLFGLSVGLSCLGHTYLNKSTEEKEAM